VMAEETPGGGDPRPAVVPASAAAPAKGTTAPKEMPASEGSGEAAGRAGTKRVSSGADALEGEALLHEVIAAFDGQIVEESPPLN
jgi:hypothetical protein